jgi:hypothetical protein
MDGSLTKKINIQQDFANTVYNDFVSVRFGMESCCLANVDDSSIKKELLDWQEKLEQETNTEESCE